MKIELPCEIVRDLLPVCIEGIADPVSREAVETHLLSCEKCRQLKDNMTNTDGSIENLKKNAETQEDAVLFKKIKKKLNKKAKAAIGISLAVIVIVVFGFQLLFNMPVKNVDLDDISVSANVYAFSDLLEAEEIDGAAVTKVEMSDGNSEDEDGEVKISMGKGDDSQYYGITLPGNNEFQITVGAMEKCEYVSAISWQSPYFLREIRWADKNDENSDVLYVSAFKTTIMNNKNPNANQTMTNLEMREINKIVYVDSGGTETVLWENLKK